MARLSRIEIVGGGPAGLYAAGLLKRTFPQARIRVAEQNAAGATFGFGVVFSDKALRFLELDDPDTYAAIVPYMQQWQDMTLVHKGVPVTIDGVGFFAIGRLQLLQILQRRARDAGVDILFERTRSNVDDLDADLIIGADGINSTVRRTDEDGFGVQLDHFRNRFAWFGTPKPFDTLTQTFVATEDGVLNAHHYRYQPHMSTFIVECDEASYVSLGFENADETETARRCEHIFAATLDGAPLVTNYSVWRRFPRLWCQHWVAGNRVLLGDAAHTAHFSIGSGTRLAMEDALALANALRDHHDLQEGLAAFEAVRKPIAKKIVDAANASALWYEGFAGKMKAAPLDFAYDYITRSGRLDVARLRDLAPAFMSTYERRKPIADA